MYKMLKEIELNSYQGILNKISKVREIKNSERVCYIYGYGKQSKKTYSELKAASGIKIIFQGFSAPWWMKPLSIFIAGQYALIEIIDVEMIKDVFEKIVNQSMAGLFSFDKSNEQGLLNYMRLNRWKANPVNYLKNDLTFFGYQIDEDNMESTTGALLIVYYGQDAPKHLIESISIAEGSLH